MESEKSCNLKLDDYCKKVDKVYTDMYIGEGFHNPSVTTRLTMTEDKIERMGKNLNKALFLVGGTLLTVIGELFIKLIK